MGKIVFTTVSPRYVPNWGIREALRELFQNGIDVRNQYGVRLEYSRDESGKLTIRDYGPGLDLKHLVMGISEKGENAIGQFGEGLKLAMLVYARNGESMVVSSGSIAIKPLITLHPDFNTEVLAFELDSIPEITGTIIEAFCAEIEFDWAVMQFSCLQEHNFVWRDTISLPSGRIYVNGQLMANGSSLFSWHFKNVSINRDRTIVEQEKLESAVKEAVSRLDDVEVIKALLKQVAGTRDFVNGNGMMLFEQNIRWVKPPELAYVRAWEQAIKILWGDRACLSSNPSSDMQAEWEKWNVIHVLWTWHKVLSRFLKPSIVVLHGKEHGAEISPTTLGAHRLRNFHKAIKALNKVLAAANLPQIDRSIEIKVVKNLIKGDGLRTDGLYRSRGESSGVIYLDVCVLDYIERTCETLGHEMVHHITEMSDCEVHFVRTLGELLGVAMALTVRRN